MTINKSAIAARKKLTDEQIKNNNAQSLSDSTETNDEFDLKFDPKCIEQTNFELDLGFTLRYINHSLDNMEHATDLIKAKELLEIYYNSKNVFERGSCILKILTLITADITFRFFDYQDTLHKQIKSISKDIKYVKGNICGEFNLLDELRNNLELEETTEAA